MRQEGWPRAGGSKAADRVGIFRRPGCLGLSEIQRGQIPKVTVKEISDAFTLLKAKVVVKGLMGWGKADELPGEERREVFSTLLQE